MDKVYKFGFLTYLSRSGSTFFARCLNEYDDICVALECFLPAELFGVKGYESPTFLDVTDVIRYLSQAMPYTKLDTWKFEILDRKLYEHLQYPLSSKALVEALLVNYGLQHKPKAKTIIYKGTPIGPWNSAEASRTFEDWKFFQIVRDPRSVYFSQSKLYNPEERRPFAINAYEVAEDWKKAIVNFKELYQSKRMIVKYEDLILNCEKTMTEVVHFLDVSSGKSKENLDYYLNLIPNREKKIHKNLKSDPKPERLDAWKDHLEEKQIYILEQQLVDQMSLFNYSSTKLNHDHSLYLIWARLEFFFMGHLYTMKRIGTRAFKSPAYYFKKLVYKIK